MNIKRGTQDILVLLLPLVLGILSLQTASTLAQAYRYTPFVAWNPNGQLLAVSSETTVTIYDANSMTVLNMFADLDVQYTTPVWSPDGASLAIANGHDLEVWERPRSTTETFQQFIYRYYERYDPPTPASPLSVIAWRHDGTEIAVANGDVIDFVDAMTGAFIRQIAGEWGHITDTDWSLDGRFAISAVLDRFGFVVDPTTGNISNYFFTGDFSTLTSSVDSVAFSPDGDKLAVGTSDSIIALWDNTQTAEYTEREPDLFFGNLRGESHTRGVNVLA